jgi:uncharacterized OsmC-like protein
MSQISLHEAMARLRAVGYECKLDGKVIRASATIRGTTALNLILIIDGKVSAEEVKRVQMLRRSR